MSDTPIIGGEPEQGNLVTDTTTADFQRDVIDASRDALVLVDFWAPWCGPCKQLTPILENAVKSARGAVRLVKLNIDEHPSIPGQMGIQSIPAVFAFKDGRPVDGFMGAVPESQVKSFIDRLAGPAAGNASRDDDLAAAEQMLEAGDAATAAQIYGALLQEDSGDLDAIGGLAKCYLQTGELDRAEETLALAPPDKSDTAAITSAAAMLALARKAGEGGDVATLRAAVDNDPDDLQARFNLAMALAAQGDKSAAVEALIAIIDRDRDWHDGEARTQLLEFFDAWGSKDPATVAGRQKLSSLLFA